VVLVAKMFRDSRLAPPVPRVTTLSVQVTITLLAGGHFVGILPASVVQFSGNRAQLKRLPIRLPVRCLAADIITIKGRTLGPLAERFIACVRDVSRPLASTGDHPVETGAMVCLGIRLLFEMESCNRRDAASRASAHLGGPQKAFSFLRTT
jgi:hypothetical protein